MMFQGEDSMRGGSWLILATMTLGLVSCSGGSGVELLNVSYDPPRELWAELNSAFVPRYEKDAGKKITINQAHGGSGSQKRPRIDGLGADVVTLALWCDTNQLARKKLIPENWDQRFPHNSLPYYST